MLKESHAFSGFSVDNLDKAEKFYRETLGLEVARDEMGIALNVAGSTPVFVYAKVDHAPAMYTILNFPVPDIDVAVDELVQRGVLFEHYRDMPFQQDKKGIVRGRQAGMGPDIAWFRDPAGNILSVLSD